MPNGPFAEDSPSLVPQNPPFPFPFFLMSHGARKKLFENEGPKFLFLQSSGSPSTTSSSSSPDVELLLRFYKQMILEMNKPAGTAVHEYRSSARPGSMLVKENKRQKLFQPEHVQKDRENGCLKTVLSSDRKPQEGSYIVGGSVSGWNFITFGGTEPIYYGLTKESFRSSHKEVRIMESSV